MRSRHVLAAPPFDVQLIQLPLRKGPNGLIEAGACENLFEGLRVFGLATQIQRRTPLRDRFVLHSFLRADVSK